MSTNPGQTKRPPASITRAAGSAPSRPTAATRPSAIPTSAPNHGLPAPSITRPPRISTSSISGSVRKFVRARTAKTEQAKDAGMGPPLLLGEVGEELAGHPLVPGEQAAVDGDHRP